jgi:photosystem II stability/assembly factor-like uncharacterized protein
MRQLKVQVKKKKVSIAILLLVAILAVPQQVTGDTQGSLYCYGGVYMGRDKILVTDAARKLYAREGDEWRLVSTPGEVEDVSSIEGGPIYLTAVEGNTYPLYQSDDGGQTWLRRGDVPVTSGYAGQIEVTTVPGLLFATTSGDYWGSDKGGVWRSTDDGLTWTLVMTDTGAIVVPSPQIDVDNTVFASFYGYKSFHGLWKSEDRGTTWQLSLGVGSMLTERPYLSQNYANDKTVFFPLDVGLFKSTDGGATWTIVAGENGEWWMRPTYMALSSEYGLTDELVVVWVWKWFGQRNDPDLYLSWDGGKTWQTGKFDNPNLVPELVWILPKSTVPGGTPLGDFKLYLPLVFTSGQPQRDFWMIDGWDSCDLRRSNGWFAGWQYVPVFETKTKVYMPLVQR